ncbi:hypothetical protein FKM82_023020 [Ascaphus truei]
MLKLFYEVSCLILIFLRAVFLYRYIFLVDPPLHVIPERFQQKVRIVQVLVLSDLCGLGKVLTFFLFWSDVLQHARNHDGLIHNGCGRVETVDGIQ